MTATTMTTGTGDSTGLGAIETKKLLWAAPAAGALSVTGNLIVYGLAKAAGLELGVAPEPGAAIAPLPIGAVLGASFLPALVAALLLAVLSRFTSKASAAFASIAGVFLLVSFFPVATVPMDGVATRVVLGVMHVVSAVAIAGGLLRLARR